MRTRHWLAGFMSGCMALAGAGTTIAQPPMMPGNGNPDQVGLGMLPSPYNMAYGPAQPNPAGMNAPGYPPGANAWPNISPFAGPPVDSNIYENGFWYNKILQGDRQYYFQVDAVFGKSSKGDTTLIGAPNVNPLTSDSIAGRTGGQNSSSASTSLSGLTQFNQAPPGSGPLRSIGASGGGTAGTTGGSQIIFGSQDTGILPDTLNGDGARASWGWFNPDDTGFVISGFYQGKGTAAWGLVDPALVIDPNNQNFNPTLHLHAWFGLPLAGADTDGTSGTSINGTIGSIKDGAVIPYDMGVSVSFTSRIAGANTDWYFNSIYDQNKIKIRPLAGAKYVRLQENFTFDGYDSGLGYTVSNSATASTGGTATTSTTSGVLTPQTLQPLFSTPNVLHSHLSSSTLSDMIGPEVGFRVDLGGKRFQLWTQTKGGALTDITQRTLSGFGIGNNFNIITPNTIPVMPNNPTLTAFNNSSTTTSLTAMFEQQINFKVPVFNLIPYLNKMEVFERAQITGGYTFLFLGEIYRPQNTINWNQYPQTPQLNNLKSNFYNSMYNLGVEWTY